MGTSKPTALAVALACTTFSAGAWADTSISEVLKSLEAEKANQGVYRAYFPDEATARNTAISFHNQLMEANYETGYLILELSHEDMDLLRPFGFSFEVATDFIAKRNDFLSQVQAEHRRRALQGETKATSVIQSVPGYSCYETVEETFAAADAMAKNKPSLARWNDVGNSWEKSQGLGGYDLRVLILTSSTSTGSKPKLFINSAIHAREYTTAPLSLTFAKWLFDGYGTNADATWILDHHEVHFMLQTNPDGRKKAESGLSWRKNTNQNYCGSTSNSRGADLNRNFSFKWNATNGQGSSGNPCSATYRGASAASEAETKAVEAYVRSLWPDLRGGRDSDPAPGDASGIHLDLHSYSQLVLWPYGHTSQAAPNGSDLQTLGRKFAYFNGYKPQQSYALYPTDGTTDNVSYGELGVPHYTFELGTSFFQSCSTYENTIRPQNLPAFIYAAKVVRTPYVTPSGPDVTSLSLSGAASSSGVPAGTQVTLTASATDLRYQNSNGTEPTQNLAGAEYYIDTPPWKTGANAVTLSASDGSFNEKTEDLTGVINTTGLAVGRHIVFVRARDTTNTWGAITAVFLVII